MKAARAKRAKAGGIFYVTRVEPWPIARLKMFHHNPRDHSDEQVDEIMALVRAVGFLVPLVVDEKRGRILSGNGRYMAALRLGMDVVPVIPVGHLSRAQQVQYVIADNRLAEKSSWRREYLAEHLAELERLGADLTSTGFSLEDVSELLAEFAPEEPPGEGHPVGRPPDVATSKRGDLWILGNHRVYCGDATDLDDLAALLGAKPADCVWTDPPYNVAYVGKTKDALKIAGDRMSDAAFAEFLGRTMRALAAYMNDGAPIYVAHADTAGLAFRQAFVDAGLYLSSCLIWRKNVLVLSRGDYHWQHEPVLYGWKPGSAHRWFGARNKTTLLEFDEPPFTQVGENEYQINLGETVLVVRGRDLEVEPLRGSVFSEPKPSASEDHPTMKPVPLIERMLANSTRPGAVVLDAFAGSGSTLVACERMGLYGRMLELDPRFVDVVLDRWQNLTKRPAIHAGSKRTLDELRGLG